VNVSSTLEIFAAAKGIDMTTEELAELFLSHLYDLAEEAPHPNFLFSANDFAPKLGVNDREELQGALNYLVDRGLIILAGFDPFGGISAGITIEGSSFVEKGGKTGIIEQKRKKPQPSRAEEIISSEAFKRCAEFHGHVCPGLAIGFKAAGALMARLGATKGPDEELVAIVETDACGADAIQVVTGCTFGKGNLILKKYGKQAFSLADRRQAKAFRASLRADAVARDPAQIALFEKVRRGEAGADEAERFRQLRQERIRKILESAPEALFVMGEVPFDVPSEAKIAESAACDICGEPTMVDLLRDREGKRVCMPCAERACLVK
jgi:formylmethanofuran dehydrogenase subunit E